MHILALHCNFTGIWHTLTDGLTFSAESAKTLIDVRSASLSTTLTLAAAHALVLLEDGIVGDPMEKTALETMKWKVSKGDVVTPDPTATATDEGKTTSHKAQIHIKRRFQFSSALKRMSTVSLVNLPSASKRRTMVAVKGAPETLKSMYREIPSEYESTYKWYAQRGSRVLALGIRWMDNVAENQVCFLSSVSVWIACLAACTSH